MLQLYHRHSALPEIYAQALGLQARGGVRIFRQCTIQAMHECTWYKYYVPLIPVQANSLLRVTNHPSQHKVKCRIYYIDNLENFDYGQQKKRCIYVYYHKRTKTGGCYENHGSSNKQYYNCFMAVALFVNCFI